MELQKLNLIELDQKDAKNIEGGLIFLIAYATTVIGVTAVIGVPFVAGWNAYE